MTAEKTNKALMWVVGVLVMIILSLVGVVWATNQTRFDKLEFNDAEIGIKIDTLYSRSARGQWTDSLIISNLAEIKQELRK